MSRWFLLLLVFSSCTAIKKIHIPERAASSMTGSGFYKQAAPLLWEERDSLARRELLSGNLPKFMRKFRRIKIVNRDSSSGKMIRAVYYVSPDYVSIGSNDDFARIPLTPMTAQQVADSFHCFLPTRKIVDDIYRSAKVKLEPVPLYAYRDSTVTMWQHHLIIEGQRKGRKGLIAGIKKDVVITERLLRDPKQNRVAIYGWHKPDGKPIQPLYTGHVNWYVDYSHGVRLIYQRIKVNGRWMNYTDVLKNEKLKNLLCDEEFCDCYRY